MPGRRAPASRRHRLTTPGLKPQEHSADGPDWGRGAWEHKTAEIVGPEDMAITGQTQCLAQNNILP